MSKIYLASASPRRRELLSQIGLRFTVRPSHGEENAADRDPKELVKKLSAEKAMEVYEELLAEGEKDFIVIGADTVVSLDGRIMGKPLDQTEAVRMLNSLQGRIHQVYTGVTLVTDQREKKTVSFAEKTDVDVFPMDGKEIQSYVRTGEPMDKAGAYGIQGRFAAFIKEIRGDYNNVVGLPLGRLFQELKKML